VKLFLVSVAIVDDVIAIVVIAAPYSDVIAVGGSGSCRRRSRSRHHRRQQEGLQPWVRAGLDLAPPAVNVANEIEEIGGQVVDSAVVLAGSDRRDLGQRASEKVECERAVGR
jgi:hypothetical protein